MSGTYVYTNVFKKLLTSHNDDRNHGDDEETILPVIGVNLHQRRGDQE
jgi:hypothetical protein